MSALPIGSREPAGGSRPPASGLAPLRMERPVPNSRLACVRPARLSDVPDLESLIAPFVAAGDLLPRSRYDLCRHVKEYHVALTPDGRIIGCVALKVYSLELAELAALAVDAAWQSRGVGRALCDAVLDDARALGLDEVFALTRKPLFFARLGFEPAAREHFPLKVWADCTRCSRRDACDEVAVTLRL